MSSPTFSEMRIVKHAIQQLLVSITAFVGYEFVDVFRRGRQSQQIEVDSANQCVPIRRRRWFNAFLPKSFDNEMVNRVSELTVDLDGATAFLPRSQVDIRPIRDIAPLMNISQPFQILKMDKRRGNIVVSRRAVLEESRAEQRSEIVGKLEEGQVVDGVVK